jgi:hypothetical protein
MEDEATFDQSGQVDAEGPMPAGLGTEIAALFEDIGFDLEVPELRGCKLLSADLDG